MSSNENINQALCLILEAVLECACVEENYDICEKCKMQHKLDGNTIEYYKPFTYYTNSKIKNKNILEFTKAYDPEVHPEDRDE